MCCVSSLLTDNPFRRISIPSDILIPLYQLYMPELLNTYYIIEIELYIYSAIVIMD